MDDLPDGSFFASLTVIGVLFGFFCTVLPFLPRTENY